MSAQRQMMDGQTIEYCILHFLEDGNFWSCKMLFVAVRRSKPKPSVNYTKQISNALNRLKKEGKVVQHRRNCWRIATS